MIEVDRHRDDDTGEATQAPMTVKHAVRLRSLREVRSRMGRRLIGEVAATPAFAQIEIRDGSADRYPQWNTGDELAVALSDAVVVATAPDTDGDVQIRIWEGRPTEGAASQAIFTGAIDVSSGTLIVGNLVANLAFPFQVGVGIHRLEVWADEPGYAHRVDVYLDEAVSS